MASRRRHLRDAAARAVEAFAEFADWVSTCPVGSQTLMACGPTLYDLLLTRGHYCLRPRDELLSEARSDFAAARIRLDEMARDTAGSWDAAQEQFATAHPSPHDYLDAFSPTWTACPSHPT